MAILIAVVKKIFVKGRVCCCNIAFGLNRCEASSPDRLGGID